MAGRGLLDAGTRRVIRQVLFICPAPYMVVLYINFKHVVHRIPWLILEVLYDCTMCLRQDRWITAAAPSGVVGIFFSLRSLLLGLTEVALVAPPGGAVWASCWPRRRFCWTHQFWM